MPMIDLIFNLLIFFVLTFTFATPEGDFSVRMADQTAAPSARSLDLPVEPFQIRLLSNDQGDLVDIRIGQRSLGQDMRQLRAEARRFVGTDLAQAADIEAELDCDPRLRYAYTMQAIDMISGYRDELGNIQPLIRRYSFTGR